MYIWCYLFILQIFYKISTTRVEIQTGFYRALAGPRIISLDNIRAPAGNTGQGAVIFVTGNQTRPGRARSPVNPPSGTGWFPVCTLPVPGQVYV